LERCRGSRACHPHLAPHGKRNPFTSLFLLARELVHNDHETRQGNASTGLPLAAQARLFDPFAVIGPHLILP